MSNQHFLHYRFIRELFSCIWLAIFLRVYFLTHGNRPHNPHSFFRLPPSRVRHGLRQEPPMRITHMTSDLTTTLQLTPCWPADTSTSWKLHPDWHLLHTHTHTHARARAYTHILKHTHMPIYTHTYRQIDTDKTKLVTGIRTAQQFHRQSWQPVHYTSLSHSVIAASFDVFPQYFPAKTHCLGSVVVGVVFLVITRIIVCPWRPQGLGIA